MAINPEPVLDSGEKPKEKHIYSLRLVESERDAALCSFDLIYSTISSKNKQFFLRHVPKDAYFKLKLQMRYPGQKDWTHLWLGYDDVPRDKVNIKDQGKIHDLLN